MRSSSLTRERGNTDYCYNPNEVALGTTSQQSRRLIQPLNLVTNIVQCDPRNRSNYHSGQLKVTQRFTGGLQFLVSYTYGKALDYGGSAASGGGAVGNPQTITNLEAGYGPSGFDVRHRAVISGVWELPWGASRRWLHEGGVLSTIAGGWQLSGIGTITTGRPFTVFMQNSVNDGAPSWPNRIGSGEWNPTVDLWYNPADFAAPPPNTYGNTGRASCMAPVTSTWIPRSRSASPCWDAPTSSSGGTRSTCSTTRASASRSRLRRGQRRAHHVDGRGQPLDAVFVQGELLMRRSPHLMNLCNPMRLIHLMRLINPVEREDR